MPALKPGLARLTDMQMKSSKTVKSMLSTTSGRPMSAQEGPPQADAVVAALVEAQPDRRPLEANRLRVIIGEQGGKAIVWDQLCRSRKQPQAGLRAVVEMLGAKGDRFEAMGQEPAACILAAVSALSGTVPLIAKQKKVAQYLLGIVSSGRCSETARRAASWVLRRLCELSARARLEIGTDRESLQALGRVMRCEVTREDLSETRSNQSVSRPASRAHSIAPTTPASRANSRSNSIAPSTPASHASVPRSRAHPIGGNFVSMPHISSGSSEGSFSLPLGASAGTFHPGGARRGSVHSRERRGSLGVEHTGVGFQSDVLEDASSQGSAPGGSRPRTALSQAPEGRQQLSFPPEAPEPMGHAASSMSRAASHMSRLRTAASVEPYSRATSRPGTGMGGLVMGRDVDPMCVQGNCCCVVGNLCHSDEVLERVCKTDGVVTGVLFLLENGTEWAAGHAARTLGNLAYSLESCKHIVQVDTNNLAIKILMELCLTPNSPKRCKEMAVYALGNLSRSSTLCTRLNAFPGVYTELSRLAQEEGVSQEDVDRAIANISQARLGTRTWRVPKKI